MLEHCTLAGCCSPKDLSITASAKPSFLITFYYLKDDSYYHFPSFFYLFLPFIQFTLDREYQDLESLLLILVVHHTSFSAKEDISVAVSNTCTSLPSSSKYVGSFTRILQLAQSTAVNFSHIQYVETYHNLYCFSKIPKTVQGFFYVSFVYKVLF